MFSIAFLLVVSFALIAAMTSGAVFGLLVALAGSVAGALFGAFLRWPEPMIWSAQLAGPLLLLSGLTAARLVDHFSRKAGFRQRQRPAEDFWPDA